MTHLGNILIRSCIPAGEVADVVWRNADLADVDFTAVAPSRKLVDELLMVGAGGPVGEHIARLVPVREILDVLVSHPSAVVRSGASANRLVSATQLVRLAGDATASVAAAAAAEIDVRDRLRARWAAGELEAAKEVLRRGRVEEIDRLLDGQPSLLSAAVASEDAAVGQLRSLDADLFSRVAVGVLTDTSCMVPYAIASWACGGGDDLVATALDSALVSPSSLRRRCTPGALRVLSAAGLVKSTSAPEPRKTYTRLEDMMLVLEPFELAGLFFSSQDPVASEVTDLVFAEAPVSLLVNFLLGQTPRRPKAGEVTSMLRSFTGERRTELSTALEEAVVKAEQADASASPLLGFPWSGELLLCLQRTRAVALPSAAATELFATVDGILAGDGLAWEYLLALEGEWESALFDLVVSAAHMEGLVVESSV